MARLSSWFRTRRDRCSESRLRHATDTDNDDDDDGDDDDDDDNDVMGCIGWVSHT